MNREIFPGGVYPLEGDVTSTAGSSSVSVTGIQNVPVSPIPPTDQQVLQYSAANKEYIAASITANASVQCNGVAVSDDYAIFVNNPGLHGQVLVNGS
jgi:hypothetical protein